MSTTSATPTPAKTTNSAGQITFTQTFSSAGQRPYYGSLGQRAYTVVFSGDSTLWGFIGHRDGERSVELVDLSVGLKIPVLNKTHQLNRIC